MALVGPQAGAEGKGRLKAAASKRLVIVVVLMTSMTPLAAAILSGDNNHNALTTDHTTAVGSPQGAGLLPTMAPIPQIATATVMSKEAFFSGFGTSNIVTRNVFKASPIAYRSGGTADHLTNGVSVTGFLNGTGDSKMWYMNVTSGARFMRSVLSGPPGNYFSLYGRLDVYPTTSSYNWSQTWSSTLDISWYNPQAGKWYIMAYSSSGKGTYLLTVTVLYTSTLQSLTSGTPAIGSLNATANSDLWYIYVTSGATSMRAVLTCPVNADFDLYGSPGYYPTMNSYHWRGTAAGNEDVIYGSPSAGAWYIMPFSYFGNGTYQLTVTITHTPIAQSLSSGVTVTGSLNESGDYDLWYVYVSSEATSMHSVLTCPTGTDFDLYGKEGSYATTSYYDWRGTSGGGEDVTYGYPISGAWYIMVQASNGSGTYQLTVTVTYSASPRYLSSGTPVTGSLAGTGNYSVWYIYVSSDATSMYSYLTFPGGASFVLYGRSGSVPTTTYYDWMGTGSSSPYVSYTYSYPSMGYWYIMVRSSNGNGTYQLTVTVSYSSGGGGGGSGTLIGTIALVFGIVFVLLIFGAGVVASTRRSRGYSRSESTIRSSEVSGREAVTEREEREHFPASRRVQCKSCGASLEASDGSCWNCGAATKGPAAAPPVPSRRTRRHIRSGICMVCKRGLEKADDMLFCPYCGSLAHKDHLLEWLHVKDYCPTCGRHLDETEIRNQIER